MIRSERGGPGLEGLIAERSLIVCVGPGGVGKTTVSAAIGLAAARLGRRAAVLTIDPARRLADALGLEALDDEIRRVPTETLGAAVSGELHAAMVDTQASYDALIRRITPDEDTLLKIQQNSVFKAISRSLARSHAYVAMERLYEAMENGGYDLVVLDTPPARNALDILDAPAQLARFLDARVVGWFLPGDEPKGLRDRIIARGGRVARRLLGLVTGDKLLDEITTFLEVFGDLREGFANRAARTTEILRADSTAFALVSSPSPASADDAAWLRHDLERRKVPIDAVVFNKSYVAVSPAEPHLLVTDLTPDDLDARFARLGPHLGAAAGDAGRLRALLHSVRSLRIDATRENTQYQATIDGFAAELPDSCIQVRAPQFDQEIRDLPGLLRLGGFLSA